jgi:hypothetical protein
MDIFARVSFKPKQKPCETPPHPHEHSPRAFLCLPRFQSGLGQKQVPGDHPVLDGVRAQTLEVRRSRIERPVALNSFPREPWVLAGAEAADQSVVPGARERCRPA